MRTTWCVVATGLSGGGWRRCHQSAVARGPYRQRCLLRPLVFAAQCAIYVRSNTPNVCVFVFLVIIKICCGQVVTRVEYDARAATDAPPWYVAIATGPRRRRIVRPSRCGRRRKPPSTASVSRFYLYTRARPLDPLSPPRRSRGFSSDRLLRQIRGAVQSVRPSPARPGLA